MSPLPSPPRLPTVLRRLPWMWSFVPFTPLPRLDPYNQPRHSYRRTGTQSARSSMVETQGMSTVLTSSMNWTSTTPRSYPLLLITLAALVPMPILCCTVPNNTPPVRLHPRRQLPFPLIIHRFNKHTTALMHLTLPSCYRQANLGHLCNTTGPRTPDLAPHTALLRRSNGGFK